jgi:hypothetical protein
MAEKIAYRIDELVAKGPFKRSTIYDRIASGELVARKCGRATVVLADEWERFLRDLPAMPAVGRQPRLQDRPGAQALTATR